MPRKPFSIRQLAIPGVHRILAWFIVLVYVLLVMNPSFGLLLELDPEKVLQGQIWRVVTGFLLPGMGVVEAASLLSPLSLLFLYITFRLITFMGDSLENVWGIEKLNAVIFGTIASVGAASVLAYLYDPLLGYALGTSSYGVLYMTIFLGFAIEFPMVEFLLMFILPVKVKWLGWLGAIITLWVAFDFSRQAGNAIPFLHAAVCFAPLLWIAIPRVLGNAKAHKRRSQFKNSTEKARQIHSSGAFHTCSVCQVTDIKDPTRVFRVLDNGDEICEQCLKQRQSPD